MNSKDYELLVRAIYQQMLEQGQVKNVVVQHNVKRQGCVTTHQIDVYWEFSLGGVTHKVAVQAKNWKGPIRKENVLTFKGVLEDLPGTVGIMVTASRYQIGAKAVANAAGIIICDLQEEFAPPMSLYPGETATFRIKGWLRAADDSNLGLLVEVARKVPEPPCLMFEIDKQWCEANYSDFPDSMTVTDVSDPVWFYGQDDEKLFTLTRVLGEFYAEMHREGEMNAKKIRRFEEPTFLKLGDPPRAAKVASATASIVFTQKTMNIELKAQDVAIFVLRNLTDGTRQRFAVTPRLSPPA